MHIVVEHMGKRMGTEEVLTDINLTFCSGHIYGLRGKNGSGKTVLLRTLCGLMLPTTGRVLIDGVPLGEGSGLAFPKSVGVLIEEPGVIRRYAGLRYLKEIAAIRGIAQEQDIVDLMLRLALDPLSRKPIRTYSLGMRQKIGIISALMEQPDLVLLDEPFNGLDEASVEVTMQLIREARERGALVIVASHDKEELDDLADVIIQMKGGRVTDAGGAGALGGSDEAE